MSSCDRWRPRPGGSPIGRGAGGGVESLSMGSPGPGSHTTKRFLADGLIGLLWSRGASPHGGPGLVAVGAHGVHPTFGPTDSDAAVWVAVPGG